MQKLLPLLAVLVRADILLQPATQPNDEQDVVELFGAEVAIGVNQRSGPVGSLADRPNQPRGRPKWARPSPKLSVAAKQQSSGGVQKGGLVMAVPTANPHHGPS